MMVAGPHVACGVGGTGGAGGAFVSPVPHAPHVPAPPQRGGGSAPSLRQKLATLLRGPGGHAAAAAAAIASKDWSPSASCSSAKATSKINTSIDFEEVRGPAAVCSASAWLAAGPAFRLARLRRAGAAAAQPKPLRSECREEGPLTQEANEELSYTQLFALTAENVSRLPDEIRVRTEDSLSVVLGSEPAEAWPEDTCLVAAWSPFGTILAAPRRRRATRAPTSGRRVGPLWRRHQPPWMRWEVTSERLKRHEAALQRLRGAEGCEGCEGSDASAGEWLADFLAHARAVPIEHLASERLGRDVAHRVLGFLDGLSCGSDCSRGGDIAKEDAPDGWHVRGQRRRVLPVSIGNGRSGFRDDDEVTISTPNTSECCEDSASDSSGEEIWNARPPRVAWWKKLPPRMQIGRAAFLGLT